MPPTMTMPDPESIADLRRRVEELEARMAEFGQPASAGAATGTVAPVAKRGWRAQVGAFGDDPVYAEIVRLGRAWRDEQVAQSEPGDPE